MDGFDTTAFFAELASNVIEKHAKDFFTAVASRVKRKVNELKVDFNLAFSRYLKNAYGKYSTIKTILNRVEPRPFYEFFETPYLKKGDSEKFLAKTVDDVLDISHFIIIQGTGGKGKSTLMKHLFLDELQAKDLIPIFVELKDINELSADYEVRDFLFKKLFDIGDGLDADSLDHALKTGSFLFLMDGYDEVFSDKRNVFFSKFEKFCDSFPDNYYVISSRPFSDFIYMQRFTVLETLPFDKEQTVSLAKKLPFDGEVKGRFVDALENGLYDRHESFASNPLLLSIMLLTFREYAEIPDKLHLFYANAFETMFFKHDATKAGFRREFRSGLGFEEFRKVFSYFCYSTYLKGKYEFTRDELMEALGKLSSSVLFFDPNAYIYDLVNCVCLLYPEGFYFRFAHRSFQEYFTAFFLKELSDEKMGKYAIKLIKSYPRRSISDSVFHQLHDMAQDRFETNILLPLLNELLSGTPDSELYDQCFSMMFGSIRFVYSTHSDGAEAILVRPQIMMLNPLFFCYVIYERYYCGVNDYEYVKRIAFGTDPLWDYCERNALLEGDQSGLSFAKVNADPELHRLIENSNLGLKIKEFIRLKDRLEEKKASSDSDLDELFG